MNTLHVLFPIIASLLLHSFAFAQPKESDTARHGPIYRMVGGSTHDFGTMPPGKLERFLYVTNVGDAPLKFALLLSSDPMFGQIEDQIILPGDTGRIRVLGDFRTTSRKRRWSSWLKLFTNDPTRPEDTIRVYVHIQPDLVAEPHQGYLWIHDLKPEEEQTQTVVLHMAGDTTATIYPVQALSLASDISIITDLIDTVRLKPGEERAVTIRILSYRKDPVSGHIGSITIPWGFASSIFYELHADPNGW